MKPEYKMQISNFLNSVSKRVEIIDDMLNARRPVNEIDAKQYMREIKKRLDDINEILKIS